MTVRHGGPFAACGADASLSLLRPEVTAADGAVQGSGGASLSVMTSPSPGSVCPTGPQRQSGDTSAPGREEVRGLSAARRSL